MNRLALTVHLLFTPDNGPSPASLLDFVQNGEQGEQVNAPPEYTLWEGHTCSKLKTSLPQYKVFNLFTCSPFYKKPSQGLPLSGEQGLFNLFTTCSPCSLSVRADGFLHPFGGLFFVKLLTE